MRRTLALVPARTGSKRVPGKNIRLFNGKPLIQWTVDWALSYPGFDHVQVSTDSVEIADLARSLGLQVPWMRPAGLAGDNATTLDVVLHALEQLAAAGEVFDQVALLQPTSPVRLNQPWDEAFQLMEDGAEAVVGVTAIDEHPFWTYLLSTDAVMTPCFPENMQLRSQDLPRAVAVNGALYLIRCDVLRTQRSFTPPHARAIILSQAVERIDIDTEVEWMEAEKLVASSWSTE